MNARPDLLADARRARAAGDVNAARRHCVAYLAASPKDAAGHHFMATLAAEAGRLDIALTHARKAAKLAPRAYPARLDLAKILSLSGREAEAIRESKAALAIRPDDPGARFEHAKVVYNSSRMPTAEPLLLAVLADRPDVGEAHAMLAAIRMTAGRAGDALESADLAVAAGLDTADLQEIRGKALLELDRPEEARFAFERSVGFEPDRLSALRGLAVASRLSGDADRAKAAFLRHVQLMPFEKRGDDAARTRVLVAEDTGLAHGFQSHVANKIYSGRNFVSRFVHPEFQFVHYLADHVTPERVSQSVGPAQLIYNNIGNAEVIEMFGGGARLAQSFAETGLPVINPVEKVARTTREENYRRLRDDPNFLFPRTVRYDPGDDAAATARRMLDEFSPPFMLRPIHSNLRGGLRIIRRESEILEEGILRDLGPCYAIDFHPSLFRTPATGEEGALQFRASVVGGRIFPDRMNWSEGCITGAAVVRSEIDYDGIGLSALEERFMNDPSEFLGASLETIFGAAIETIDLDIFGIDFGLTADGRIIMFEANASMVLFSKKHDYYSRYRIEPRLKFEACVAEHLHRRAGHLEGSGAAIRRDIPAPERNRDSGPPSARGLQRMT